MDINNKSTLIILDWDDSIYPSTWIMKNNIDIDSVRNKMSEHSAYFSRLDRELEKLIVAILRCGDLVIITNAMMSWIYFSSGTLPKTATLLRNAERIKIISAREKYQSVSSSLMEWKKYAFQEVLTKSLRNKKINNIISVGDAEYEYHALINLYNDDHKNYKLLKSVKFIRYPNNHQLLDQINVLNNAIVSICKSVKHLDLKFQPIK